MTGATSTMMALRDPDIRLMLRVRADDQLAFSELVQKFQHRLVGVMHHLVGQHQEAEDLAQEVFLRVYRHRKQYSPKAKFSTWLFHIANNLALNAIRDRQRRKAQHLNVQESSLMPANKGPAPQQQLNQTELAGVIRAAMDELNERQRMAVVLNKFEDMSYEDIATVMGLSMKAVKSLLSRARGKLRERLQPYIDMDSALLPDEEADGEHEEN
jgi:RNA polymerase sigma-70 factor, ECF subfamily